MSAHEYWWDRLLEALGALDCGGKRKRDTAFGGDFRWASAMAWETPLALPASEGGVALTLPAAVQGHAPQRRVASELSDRDFYTPPPRL